MAAKDDIAYLIQLHRLGEINSAALDSALHALRVPRSKPTPTPRKRERPTPAPRKRKRPTPAPRNSRHVGKWLPEEDGAEAIYTVEMLVSGG
jgi:hypothetical protein